MGSDEAFPRDFPHPLIAAANAKDPSERRRLVREFTAPIFKRMDERRAAGICCECDEPVANPKGTAIEDTYCVAHARDVEIQFLAAEQQADEGDGDA